MRREKLTQPKSWHLLISLVILLSVEASALSAVRLVPSRDYPTIQSAINAAVNNDVIVVAPGTYTGYGNRDLDFGGKAITVKSTINLANPDWNIIAATVIDCGGSADEPHRAFWFHTHEGSNSQVLGFTIKNGYVRDLKGANGSPAADPPVPYESIDPADPNGAPRAENGHDSAVSNGYGGGILCGDPCNLSAFASPTIKYCVITNCTVTGGQGGDGANGQSGTWSYQPPYDVSDPNAVVPARVNVTGGQWGGIGGDGYGNGYGGGIACLGGSSPSISDCIIEDNFARGGCGGAGGAGGNAVSSPANASPPNYNGGNGSFGGNAGNSHGNGIGGGIYCENSSSPSIVNCTFSNNIATTGARAVGGVLGQGTAIPAPIGPATNGADGFVLSGGGIAGGAAYYSSNPLNAHPSDANFTNCTFTANKAYEAYPFFISFLGEDISAYTVGGALYSDKSNKVTLNTCDFIDNVGGAVYCGNGSTLNINNAYNPSRKCLFTSNSNPNGSGGAVYIGRSSNVNIQNSVFGGNSAAGDGGALKSESGIALLQNCSFGGNTAQNGYGGAADVYTSGALSPLVIAVNNCSFSSNQSMFGGGFSSENFNATLSSCYFIGNTAGRSGGLDLVNGEVTITGSVVKDNVAAGGNGGGLNCQYTKATIRHSTFTGNLASGFSPSGGCGGAIYFDGLATLATTHRVFNCLITGNSATVDGGAIYSYNATPEIKNCTFDDDFADGFGGAIFSNYDSLPQITNCIFRECSSHAIHEADYGGNAHATYCLFYDNYNGDYYDSGTHLVYKGASQVGSIPPVPPPNNNLYGDPLFVTGDLGGYYLSQIAAGQGSNSPAWDSGIGTALSLGLNTYTTRTDNVGDAGQVDRGYHYRNFTDTTVKKFKLTASVVGGHGTVAPTSPQPIDDSNYYAGTIVTLTATPNTGWLVKAWTGTDNDSSTKSTSTVVMYADRTVTVEFRQPRTLIVSVGGGQPGSYSDIQDAVFDADNGDTIVVYAGTYYSGYLGRALIVDRSVLITSRNPDDPCCVAATIIDGLLGTNAPGSNSGVLFTSNSTGAVLNGLTIQNCGGILLNGLPGDRNLGHPNGYDGSCGEGGAIYVAPGVGPTIKNCVLRNNWIIGGNGGIGVGATTTQNAGRGGWSGWVHGGAIYCAPDSSPTFINCRITNNNAIGGNGGNGGNDVYPGGYANYGGTWSRAGSPASPAYDFDPFSLNITPITSGNLWEVWQWDEAFLYWPMYGKPLGTSYIGDYRWYSGYGGGAYCDVNSSVTFIDCQISGNLAQGGMSGRGGLDFFSLRPIEPLVPYEIPSFGGGAYCAAGATVTFTGCAIANNISSPPVLVNPADPASGLRFRLDPYLGHGGGVCAEDTAQVVFNNCTFSENEASVGGGFNWADANPAISDCNFTFNSAFQGGGLFGEHGPGTIIGCNITNNEAVSDPNVEGELLGAGGGIHCWATDVNIIDCNISSNQAETSGGGVYFGGENYSSLFNCLITKNLAGRDGGGVSANIYSDVNIANCTITGNVGGKFGGGLYCSYSSLTHIIDSIIWGNFAVKGSQIAIGNYSLYDPQPSVVEVAYSDIGPRYSMTAFGVEESTQASSLSVAQVVENQTIENEIQGSGWAKIVITLDEPLELKRTTNWNSSASVAALQAEINNRQQAVLSTLTSQEFQLRYRCNNVTTFSGLITSAGLNKLINNPQIKFIEPVRYYCPVMKQGLSLTNGMGIRPTYSGSGVAVAIVDTGVDYRHPKLGGGSFPNSKVIGGYDTGMMDADPLPVGEAHGTSCAGIAAGDLANVGDYIGGVAYNAKIYALKAAADNNSTFATDAILAAWDWCITHKNDNPAYPILVISNSLGGGLYNSKAEADAAYPAAAAAVATAVKAGITVLAASGNDGAGNAISAPAALSNVISVGAVYDTTDRVIGYSNTATILDMLAPSDPTYTTDIIGAGGYAGGDYFPAFNGTSAACPFAAGAVAVLQSAAKQKLGHYLTPEQVRIILTASGDLVTDAKAPITKPRVNLGAMVDSLFGSPIYIEQGCRIEHNWWNAATNTWDAASHNLSVDSDPLFTRGRLGNYYLSQIAAGQLIDSNAVDAGSTTAIIAGMDTYSTRTDNVKDSNQVDMGFHYKDTLTIPNYTLTTIVDPLDKGTIIPSAGDHFYKQYSQVELTATASDSRYRFKAWRGTDDDTKKEVNPANGEPCSTQHNIVTMDSDKQVTAEFETRYVSLVVSVAGGNGSVTWSPSPDPPEYLRGTVVTLTATPNTGWLVKAWTGTDNDGSTELTNTVVMYADRTVTVEFRQPRTLIVSVGGGQQGYYSDIRDAVVDADNGDTVVVYPGTYYGLESGYALVVDRSIIITSRNPDDPCCVAATIIDGLAGTNPWVNWGILFTSNSTGAVLNGLTIQNCGGYILNSLDGTRTPVNHPDGYDGGSSQGAAILVVPGVGPTIKNCVIRNNQIIGGNGGNGVGATTTQNAGRGGWGGWVHGGAIYCAPDSSPRFINCRITNNNAIGGNGGNGGNDVYPGGFANYGGTWSRAGSPASPAYDIDPLSLTITPIIDGSYLWERWQWDEAFLYWPMYGKPLGTSYFGDYRWYSGYGGGAYCDVNSNVTFIDCQISGNLAQGGMSGQGGLQVPSQRPLDPLVPYEIPSFGGGVYCAAGATVTFTGCAIANNISSPPVLVDPANPASGLRFRLDPYLGHGGGVCAEDTAQVVFNNCTFSENEASVGGGFNWANANPAISDCNFTFNSAFQGGGLFGEHGPGTIIGCNITNNEAVSDPNVEGELLGAGGGIHCWATDVNIIDCNISSNQAETSGGGVYFGGENYSSLINCLITKNLAGRDGGGVSANIYSDVNIVNCTITNNIVGGQGYGGGLYSYYHSYVDVIDSIIWGNVGATGSQLALGTGFVYDPIPSTADVSYSVIGPPRNVKAIIEPAEALAITVTNDASVLANAILGPGIELVGQPRYTGADTAAGTFVGGLAAGIGIESGIILTSGNANLALPPNTSDGITAGNNLPGDPDLNVLLQARGANAAITYDAAILEVTFTTRGGSLFFNFVFASDEYNEFVNSPFNDVFGFFLDGRNIALIPGTTTPVAVNNVNGGNPLGINASNSHLFHNNDISDGGPFFDIEYDGFTSVFTAQALNVGSGTHTIRLAIADTNDYVLDSAVFIEAGSFSDKPSYSAPIYVDKGCTLIGWNPNAPDPNNPWMPATHNLRIDADPLFVEGYYLSQIAAGQSVDSNCVDAGHTDANKAGMYRHTTRTDLVVEDPNSLVDLGYHYVRTSEFISDLNYDGAVDFADISILVLNWLDQCDFPDWCHGADLNRDGIVNGEDYAIIAQDIEDGLKEKTPPVPNPMTWEAVPTSAPGETWAKMTATKAKDAYGGTIQYYFQRTNASGVPDGFYRNWDPNRTFTNTGLNLNQTYGYRVKARDARHNATGWSYPIRLVTVGQVSPPSAPTNLVATAVSQTRINLTWTDTENETGFKIERRTGAGSFTQIADTFAANVNTYSDTGLAAGTTYTYRVRAYITGGDSSYSNEASATTQSGGGPSGEPNQPIMASGNVDPNCSQTNEIDPSTGKAYWYHTVVATVPDIGGGQTVWFRFVCNSQSVFSSPLPWISSAGTFPMTLPHPVSSIYPPVVVNVNGTTVTYRIMVKQGGASGYGMSWKVCASFNADGSNSACSANLTIPWR